LGQKNKKVQYLINPILNDEIEKKLIDVKNKIKRISMSIRVNIS
jgi:hypothetical protein